MASPYRKLINGSKVLFGGIAVFTTYSIYSGNEKYYRQTFMPLIQKIVGAEKAHQLAIKTAKYGLYPRPKGKDAPILKTRVWDMDFHNPVGLAAGFDKQGEAVDSLINMGFGFVEIGSITPEPQEGNPKPRVFRLKEDKAIINRYGFNSDGHDVVYDRLKKRSDDLEIGIMGINLGKNKTSENAVNDYVKGVNKFGSLAGYLVINVSSPNTTGLRSLQGRQQLQELVDKVVEARNKLDSKRKPPILIKIAPDLNEQDKLDIAAVVGKSSSGVNGLIISNTTVSRPETLQSNNKEEVGGLSGEPLKDLATNTLKDMYKLTKGKLPIIGAGGISSGKDAYDKIRAGASLVQLYSVLAYEGPPCIGRIKRELTELLKSDGFESVAEAVGADLKK